MSEQRDEFEAAIDCISEYVEANEETPWDWIDTNYICRQLDRLRAARGIPRRQCKRLMVEMGKEIARAYTVGGYMHIPNIADAILREELGE